MGRPKNYRDSTCEVCGNTFYRRTHGYEVKPKYCSFICYKKSGNMGGFKRGHKVNLGRPRSKEAARKTSIALMGHPVSKQTLEKIKSTLFKPGMIPWNKGTRTMTPARKIRVSGLCKKWTREIRKLYSECVFCGSKNKLQADHIFPIYTHPHLAFDINNGRVLCKECHIKTETYGGKVKKYA